MSGLQRGKRNGLQAEEARGRWANADTLKGTAA
jgi:hypothetical protein